MWHSASVFGVAGCATVLQPERVRFCEVSRMVSRAFGAFRRLLADRRGMSAMELTLISLVLVPTIFAVVELGNAAQQQIQLQQALRAGGQYAMKHGCDPPCSDPQAANIRSAVTASLPSNWGVTVDLPASHCACYDTTTSTIAASCDPPNTACPNPTQVKETSIWLTASKPYTGTLINTTISASYVVRSQ
jgi:Flp pilus assembly protein TadG